LSQSIFSSPNPLHLIRCLFSHILMNSTNYKVIAKENFKLHSRTDTLYHILLYHLHIIIPIPNSYLTLISNGLLIKFNLALIHMRWHLCHFTKLSSETVDSLKRFVKGEERGEERGEAATLTDSKFMFCRYRM